MFAVIRAGRVESSLERRVEALQEKQLVTEGRFWQE